MRNNRLDEQASVGTAVKIEPMRVIMSGAVDESPLSCATFYRRYKSQMILFCALVVRRTV